MKISDLPKLESEAVDYTFIYGTDIYETRVHFLSYETEENLYAIIKLEALDTSTVLIDEFAVYEGVEYSDKEEALVRPGIYNVENSTLINNRDNIHFIFASNDGSIEIICSSYELVKTMKSTNSMNAFVEYKNGTV